jgi:hypothetical protein
MMNLMPARSDDPSRPREDLCPLPVPISNLLPGTHKGDENGFYRRHRLQAARSCNYLMALLQVW